MNIETYTLPAYWASYLINNDASGTNDFDVSDCDEFIDSILEKNTRASCIGCGEESYFLKTNDSRNGLWGDVLDYTFDIGTPKCKENEMNSKKMFEKLDEIEDHLGEEGGMVYVPCWSYSNPFPSWLQGQAISPLIAARMCQEDGIVVRLTTDSDIGQNVAAMGWI